jgi:hypothetical protein
MDGAPFDATKMSMAFWTPISEKAEKAD